MSPEEAQRLGPDVYQALYGPGWEKIPGTPEHRQLQAYPDFRGLINEEAFRQAVEGFPMSPNVEDRRHEKQPKSLKEYVEAARPFMQWLMARGGSLR